MPSEERRAAIVAAVLPLLIDRGAGVTSRELAAAAGVSEGTIFKVFADKEELLDAALDVMLDQGPFEAAVASIDRSLDPVARFVRAVEIIQQRIVEIVRLISHLGDAHHRAPKRRPLPDSPALVQLCSEASSELRISPVDAARLLRALTMALSHPMMVSETKPATEVVELFLRGAGTTSGGTR